MYFLKLASLTFLLASCTSYEQFKHVTEDFEVPAKTFKHSYNQTWVAVLEVMRDFEIELQNQESGVIKTRWKDNTIEMN